MRFVDEKGRPGEVDKATLQAMDRADGRERIPAHCLDYTIGIIASEMMVRENTRHIEKLARKYGCYRLLRCGEGMIRKAVNILMDKMSASQNLSVTENTRGAHIMVSVGKSPISVNMPDKHVDVLVNLALEHCQERCLCDEAEAQKCPVRDVLSTIPGVTVDDDFIGWCPYMGARMEGKQCG